nr:retrovirus-related Pol polyprotein from transposon TNT 1-94 [Tanacetum cinerariifolium]
GNKDRLDDFQAIHGGKVTFGGGEGRISGKGTIRTPTLDFENQNEVSKRKNKALIEAARTMLADSKLPTMFWTEVVRTACYVLNRVSVTSPHNKTPYALLTRNIPTVSHFKPFGCNVTILNTSDHLGKFDGKVDEGYIVGYSASNKAYKVYNVPNKRVEETMNLQFLKDKPNVQGLGHEWTPAGVTTILPGCIPVPTVPASDTTVPTDDVPVHSSNLTDSMFDGEPTTRFPCPSDLGNHNPSPGKYAIRTKWILKNKRDARGIVVRNNARLIAQGHRQEEGIDYDEVFTPFA